ncbi:MAG: hypothetical protein KKF26_00100 [Chloroflexi bacterium]|nr:hypothetical protein [Chloroflexota bacterium]
MGEAASLEQIMRYAEVSVNSPAAQRRTFSYAIPHGLSLEVGQAVWVPFGDKRLQGIVLELTDYPAVEETREIVGIIEPPLRLSPQQVLLAHWISEYYLSPLFDAVALMLPPGFERKVITFISCRHLLLNMMCHSSTRSKHEFLILSRGMVSSV